MNMLTYTMGISNCVEHNLTIFGNILVKVLKKYSLPSDYTHLILVCKASLNYFWKIDNFFEHYQRPEASIKILKKTLKSLLPTL